MNRMLKTLSKMLLAKFLSIMLFILPIMLVLCSNMNNSDVKFYCLNVLLEYLQYENRFVILSMHFSVL